MTKPRIREFEPKDRLALIGLVRELQASEASVFDRMKPPSEIGEWYLDGLLEACRLKNGKILVATQGDEPLGYAVILTEASSKDEADELEYTYAYVQDLVVTQSLRGRGLGSQLLARCEEIAREAGARWLRVTVFTENTDAVRVYEKSGFRSLFSEMEKPLDS
jgi:GNAT superfamily N-acetyltransferase